MSTPHLPATSVRREIEVDSPPEDVWEVLVDDDERSAWIGGRTVLDPSPGGTGWFEDPDGSRRSATVDEADPNRRLSWTWWPADDIDDGAPSRVEIDLTPLPGGTRISVTETPVTSTASARASAFASGSGPLLDLELRLLLRSAPAAFARV